MHKKKVKKNHKDFVHIKGNRHAVRKSISITFDTKQYQGCEGKLGKESSIMDKILKTQSCRHVNE